MDMELATWCCLLLPYMDFPFVESNPYNPHFLFRNAQINTIAPTLWRKVTGVEYHRQRLELPDGDFLDLDCALKNSKTALLIIHGLEGSSSRPYVLGMAKAANAMNWDAIAMNLRGCSGAHNRLLSTYHSGKSEDVASAVAYLQGEGYEQIFIVGFSLGGNMLLKYAGELGARSSVVKAVVGISVPCHLEGSAKQLKKWYNKVYMLRFLNTLKQKALVKKRQFPEAPFTVEEITACRSFHDFDEVFTARVNGFESAVDYWTRCSSKQLLENIETPTLLINALDDPFLNADCFPFAEARANSSFQLLTPKKGGHVGFCSGLRLSGSFWTEQVVIDFFNQHIAGGH